MKDIISGRFTAPERLLQYIKDAALHGLGTLALAKLDAAEARYRGFRAAGEVTEKSLRMFLDNHREGRELASLDAALSALFIQEVDEDSLAVETPLSYQLIEDWPLWPYNAEVKPSWVTIMVMPQRRIREQTNGIAALSHDGQRMWLPSGLVAGVSGELYRRARKDLLRKLEHETTHLAQILLENALMSSHREKHGGTFKLIEAGRGPRPSVKAEGYYARQPVEFYPWIGDEIRRYLEKGEKSPRLFVATSDFFQAIKGDGVLWERAVREFHRGIMDGMGDTVGGRLSTQKDPKAKPEAVLRLAKKDPLAALAAANCPSDLWWQLAEKYPMQAILSPMYPIYIWEEPYRWKDMEQRLLPTWLRRTIDFDLPPKQRQLLWNDAKEHALPVYESSPKMNPADLALLREMIRVKRKRAEGLPLTRMEEEYTFMRGLTRRKMQPDPLLYQLLSVFDQYEQYTSFESLAKILEQHAWTRKEEELLWYWKRALWYLSQGEIVGALPQRVHPRY